MFRFELCFLDDPLSGLFWLEIQSCKDFVSIELYVLYALLKSD